VISRTETNDKIAFADPHLFPVFSILDPEYTFSVSARQTAAGCADAMNHVMEQYFTDDTTLLNDGFCESMLRSLMANVRDCLRGLEGGLPLRRRRFTPMVQRKWRICLQ
jgi:hypothetical protein